MADAAAHVHLGRGLGEREVVGAEARLALRPEHLLAEVVERALEVAEGNALVHHQALDLVELGQVAGVCHVAAVHLARRDDVDGKLLVLHGMHLHARGLRAQKHVGLAAHGRGVAGAVHHVERVLHAAAGMVGRGVQRLEVVVVGLLLGPMGHRVAQPQEHLGDLVDELADQVARADLLRTAGQRHVHRARVDLRRQLGRRKLGLARGQRLLHRNAHLVHGFAHCGALLFRHLAHAAQVPRQRARLAQHRHAHLLKRGGLAGLGDGVERPRAQRLHFFHDCHAYAPFPSLSSASGRWGPAQTKRAFSRRWSGESLPDPRTREGSRGTTLVDGAYAARPVRPAAARGARLAAARSLRSVTGAPGKVYCTSALARPAFNLAARKGIAVLVARVLSAGGTRL